MNPILKQLKIEVGALHQLLAKPENDRLTWHAAVTHHWERIARLWSEVWTEAMVEAIKTSPKNAKTAVRSEAMLELAKTAARRMNRQDLQFHVGTSTTTT